VAQEDLSFKKEGVGTACFLNAKVVTAHGAISARYLSDVALGWSLPGFEKRLRERERNAIALCGGCRVIEAMTIRFGRFKPPNVKG